MNKKGNCPTCDQARALTRHHIYPCRHFGRGKKNPGVFLLCRNCHDELERYIPYELMPRDFYKAVICVFYMIKRKRR